MVIEIAVITHIELHSNLRLSGHITSVQCIPFTIELGNICQTSKDARKIGAPPACQRNAIRMAFRWRADSGPQFDSGWVCSRIIGYIK